ncbi:MAG: hypothetical protein HZB51_24655 [Chloroflexi bacterium]|nr:hypothetical protein [Chloroflexota bacterium]
MRGFIAELISSRHQVTVVDMEAGLEHLSRAGGTLRHVDELFIIAEMDRKALETARRTFTLAKELEIPRIGLIGNKLRDETDRKDLEQFCAEAGIELVAALAFDESTRQADRRGVALYDFDPNAITVQLLNEVVNRLEKQFDLLPSARQAYNSETKIGNS